MLLDQFLSPADERSIFKGIPMALRESHEVRNLLMTGRFRIRYRGPSNPGYRRPQSHMVRRDATSFAIYPVNERDRATREYLRKKFLQNQ